MKKLAAMFFIGLLSASCNSVSSNLQNNVQTPASSQVNNTSPATSPITESPTSTTTDLNIDCTKSDTGIHGNSSLLKIFGLSFNLPTTWVVSSKNSNQACILTATNPYKVYLEVSINKNNQDAVDNYILAKNQNNITRLAAAEIYSIACVGPFDCDGAKIGNDYYTFYWNVDGTQPVPTDVDGVWMPDHNFSHNDIWKIMESIKPSN